MKKKTFPTLYAKASTGKIKVWRIWAEETAEGAAVVTEYGYEGSEKLQTTSVKVNQGKNIGRSNATTAFEQACFEAESKWKKQQDKKYTHEQSTESDALLPMLAHDYKKRGHHIEFPAYIQPKLNGVRCLATKISEAEVRYLSRGGKEFTILDHLTPALLNRLQIGETVDGELFHQEWSFQEIVSAVKRKQELTEKIQYWIYDLVLEGVPFEERKERVSEVARRHACDVKSPLVQVWTQLVNNEEEMLQHHAKYTELGFEGTIIRNVKGLYRKDFRSPDLQKYKDFIDEEFEIIGGKEGTGQDEGTVIFLCQTEEGKPFECRPRGTREQRRQWWNQIKKIEGRMLTVRYQNRSDTNIPIFPVGISIREGSIDEVGAFKPDL